MDFDPKKGFGTLSAGNPSWTDQLAGGFSNIVGMLGAPAQGQRNAYDFAQKGAGLIPGVGQALSANDAYRSFKGGDIPRGVLSTMGAIPIPGAFAGKRLLSDALKEAEPMGGKVITESGSPAILAYHGSPFNFDKFSDANIGSATETASGGYGHYFGENPNTAHYYKLGGLANPSSTNFYQVKIDADPDKFMKLPAKYKDQPKNVRDAVENIGYKPSSPNETGYDTHENLVDHVLENHANEGSTWDQGSALASKMLSERGVPGFIQGSEPNYLMPNPSGSNDYVVFDPSSVSILKKTSR